MQGVTHQDRQERPEPQMTFVDRFDTSKVVSSWQIFQSQHGYIHCINLPLGVLDTPINNVQRQISTGILHRRCKKDADLVLW
jgi:hypothetical protein